MQATITEYISDLSDVIRDLIKTGQELQYELPAEDYEGTYIVQDWLYAIDRAKKLIGDK